MGLWSLRHSWDGMKGDRNGVESDRGLNDANKIAVWETMLVVVYILWSS